MKLHRELAATFVDSAPALPEGKPPSPCHMCGAVCIHSRWRRIRHNHQPMVEAATEARRQSQVQGKGHTRESHNGHTGKGHDGHNGGGHTGHVG